MKYAPLIAVFLALLAVSEAHAAIQDTGVFDTVLQRYQNAAAGWAGTIQNHAARLFWALTAISMIWTFGFMAIRRADLSEFFAEFIRFTVTTGFFFWLLSNGPVMAKAIIDGLWQIGAEASGTGSVTPTSLVDIGFDVFIRAMNRSSLSQPIDSLVGILLSAVILIILALVAANMLVTLCAAWVMSYAGIFYLGFGGGRWTSDLAINYYRAVLGIGMRLFTLVLIVGIGTSILDQYYRAMETNVEWAEMGVILFACVILLYLVDKLPAMVAEVAHHGGGAGRAGSFGAAAGLAATGLALEAGRLAGQMIGGAATEAAGALSALKAASESAHGQNQDAEGGSGPENLEQQANEASRQVGGSSGPGGEAPGQSAGGGKTSTARVLASGVMAQALAPWNQAVGESFGGRVAARIRAAEGPRPEDQSRKPPKALASATFGADSLGKGNPDRTWDDDIAAFVNRDGSAHDGG